MNIALEVWNYRYNSWDCNDLFGLRSPSIRIYLSHRFDNLYYNAIERVSRFRGIGRNPKTREETLKNELVDLNFKVPRDLRRQFKSATVACEMSNVDFLQSLFKLCNLHKKFWETELRQLPFKDKNQGEDEEVEY